MSEFNESKIALLTKDQTMIEERNKRNDNHLSYQIAKDMFNTTIDDDGKALWFAEMNYWAKELTVRNPPPRVVPDTATLQRTTPASVQHGTQVLNSRPLVPVSTVTQTQSLPIARHSSNTKQRMNFHEDSFTENDIGDDNSHNVYEKRDEVTIDLMKSDSDSESVITEGSYHRESVLRAQHRRKYLNLYKYCITFHHYQLI